MLAQNRTVKGRVLSAEDKEPLIGATDKISGTSIGVETDIDGNFSLEVPDKDKTLAVSYTHLDVYKRQMVDSNIPSVAYATVYPIAMVFLIL